MTDQAQREALKVEGMRMEEPKQHLPWTCGSCAHWVEECSGCGVDGICRRYPPMAAALAFVSEECQPCAVYPHTAAGDWCGEYKPKEG